MTQIIFDNRLANQLVGEHGRISDKPFVTWYVSPISINNHHQFYLFVERDSGLPVFTNLLNKATFAKVYKACINHLGFLVATQRAKLIKIVTKGIFYHYQRQFTNLLLDKYCQFVAKHPGEVMEGINDGALTIEGLANMSTNLISSVDNSTQTLQKVYKIANRYAPVKVRRPRAGVSYVTATPHFTDPRQWSKYEGQKANDHLQVVNAIKHNNNKIIQQFQDSIFSGQALNAGQEKQFLKEYLNKFLPADTINVVTTNLTNANVFIWGKIPVYEEEIDDYTLTLENFYAFLSTVGIVTKADAQRISKYVKEDYRLTGLYNEADDNGEFNTTPNVDNRDAEDELGELLHNLQNHPEVGQQLIQDQHLSSTERQVLEALMTLSSSNTLQNIQKGGVIEYNGDQLDHTYVIDAKLRNFRPTMSRRFQIGGNLTINQLIVSVLTMFKASFEHPYDLTDDQSQEVDTAPDMVSLLDSPFGSHPLDGAKIMISSLNKGDHLTLHYDYGDGWAFSIVVKDIKAVKPDKYPKILKGKGYGIIDDIGGVSALRAYRQDYLQHQVSADVKDLLGGELVDLDHFDKAATNHALKAVLDE